MTLDYEALLAGNDIGLRKGHVLPGGYAVVRRLGAGATAVIFEVETDGRRYAAKVLRPDVLDHEFVRTKFDAEIGILTRLQHPNIVRVHDSIRDGQLVACILDLVDGSTLEQYIPLHAGGLSEVLALQLALQVVDAMTYAHSHGIVHRDLKPSNILVQQRPEGLDAVVADFGLAKALGTESNTRTGLRIGTVAYMAPEQVHDSSRVDERADIYALGITLYECLTGSLPFPYKSIYEVVQAQLSQPIPAVRNRRVDVVDTWDSIIERACAKRLEERYQTSAELLADLTRLARELGALDRNTVAVAPVNPARESLLPACRGTDIGPPAAEDEDDGPRSTAVANIPPPAFASLLEAAEEPQGDPDPSTILAPTVGVEARIVSSDSAATSTNPFERESTDRHSSPRAVKAALRTPAATVSQVDRHRRAPEPEAIVDAGAPTPDVVDSLDPADLEVPPSVPESSAGEQASADLERTDPDRGVDFDAIRAATSLAGISQAEPIRASGEAASGEAGSGEAGSGDAASSEAASGEAASGEAGSGEAGSGEAGSGEAASGERPDARAPGDQDTIDEISAGSPLHGSAEPAPGARSREGSPAGLAAANDPASDPASDAASDPASDPAPDAASDPASEPAARAARADVGPARRDSAAERRAAALAMLGETGPSRTAMWVLVALVSIGLAALSIGLYVATR